MGFIIFSAVTRLPVSRINLPGPGIVLDVFLQCQVCCHFRFCRFDRIVQDVKTGYGCIGLFVQILKALDMMFPHEEEGFRHLFQVINLRPALVTGTFSLLHPLLDIDQ